MPELTLGKPDFEYKTDYEDLVVNRKPNCAKIIVRFLYWGHFWSVILSYLCETAINREY